MSTDDKPCPVNYRHVIVLAVVLVLELLCTVVDSHTLYRVSVFSFLAAGFYWAFSAVPWSLDNAGKGWAGIRKTNWACWVSVVLLFVTSGIGLYTSWGKMMDFMR